MVWSTSEDERVQAIETRINEIQTALNNVASRQQMKSILNLRQREIDELTARVAALESQVAALQTS